MPRDNLLCSACLDLFELIKKENIKDLVKHLIDKYRDKIEALSYLETFRDLLMRGDQPQGYANNMETYFLETEDDGPRRPANPAGRPGLMEHITVDPDEEAYLNASDDEEETQIKASNRALLMNGSSSPAPLPLVDYPSDEEPDENGDTDMTAVTLAEGQSPKGEKAERDSTSITAGAFTITGPPERLSEKRRREEEDDDELGKLMHNKRRNSSSASMNASAAALRKKKSFTGRESPSGVPKKIAISLSPALTASSRQDEEAR